jgi:predicted metal-dependent phosphoesterase TrpH
MTALRIAAHVHSDWSYDGQWPLAAIARAFRRQRYDAVLMTEHDRGFDQERWDEYQRQCAAISAEGLLLIPGIEYEDPDNVVHIAVWGETVPFLGSAQSTLDLLQTAHRHQAISVFAHPWRRDAHLRYQNSWKPLLTAVEIWNRKYDGVAPRPEAVAFATREGLAPFVSLDFHTARQFFPLSTSVQVIGAPSPEAVIAALRTGRYEPQLLGLSARRFTSGAGGAATRALEDLRLRLRGPARKLARRIGRRSKARSVTRVEPALPHTRDKPHL